ncbi:MAG: nicotinate-nucleotide--dimethylbenzimidazole phosphoribosyltransferase [Bacteroidota bacterium]
MKIQIPDQRLTEKINHKIDLKTKPLGALGQLEELALKIALILQTDSPKLNAPHIFVFAADHGIANAGVSAYPQEVTYQMVYNFLGGGAAINVFTKQNRINLQVVDAGVAHDFQENDQLIHQKVAMGTQRFDQQAAMSESQLIQCLDLGTKVVGQAAEKGCNIIGFGEMGIGNTSSASMLMSYICQIPIADCVGRGTGVSDEQFLNKIKVLQQAKDRIGDLADPRKILLECGGFEIAQMVGAMMEAASKGIIIMVDGFIATSAFLAASALDENIKHYALFAHQSDEAGHGRMLEFLDAKPILKMNLRLGEGTGCALAYPIVENAVAFLNEMASFESAGVSNKD